MTAAGFVLLALLALGVAAVGAGCRRTAPAAARWLAWAAAIACAAAGLLADGVELDSSAASAVRIALDDNGAPQRTRLLAAAAAAGPRADDLEVAWQMPLADALGGGVLGARPLVPPPLPLGPDDVRVELLAPAAVGRPLALRIAAPELPVPVAGELIVRWGGGDLHRAAIQLGAGAIEATCVPAAAGTHEVAVVASLSGHTLRLSAAFEVGQPPRVLVLDPSGLAAAALRAQGVAVTAAAELPADWREHAALVLAEPLGSAAQDLLLAAVIDGLGLFVLAPGFGRPGEPLRAVLPVRPLPEQPGDGPGDGGARDGADGAPRDPPSGTDPPPPDDQPPRGDASGALPVSSEPIDVDKHSIAMVLVVDRSGSMGAVLPNGQIKMSYAKTSADRTARALGEGDQVAVVTFGDKDRGRIELPLTDATDRQRVQTGIERLAHAAEQTYLLSGLRLAGELLRSSRAAVKHIVVVTDGEFNLRESIALRAEANRLRSDGKITLSMISIIDRFTDPQFRREAELLTQDGGGQFLPVDDPTVVPVLVSAEVTRALSRVGRKPRSDAGGSDVPERPGPLPPPPPPRDPPRPTPPVATPDRPRSLPVRAVAESPLLAPAPAEWPMLGGAVATEGPLDARVLLTAGDDGWPLLAYANRGLGRIGAFAADLGGPDGREFRAAEPFPGWFAQWVTAVLPAEPRHGPLRLPVASSITPPAPVPADLRHLQALAGAPPLPPGSSAAAPVTSRRRVDRVPDAARWLPLVLLALVTGERLATLLALRRGRLH